MIYFKNNRLTDISYLNTDIPINTSKEYIIKVQLPASEFVLDWNSSELDTKLDVQLSVDGSVKQSLPYTITGNKGDTKTLNLTISSKQTGSYKIVLKGRYT